MRHRQGAFAIALSAAALSGAAAPPPTGEVTVVAKNLRNARGVVRACLTSEATGFPDCANPDQSFQAVANPVAGAVVLTFRGVPPGRYAVALLHDENGNGKADRAAMMIPKEGFGFSRDAPVRFGPPSFGAAAFDLPAGAREELVIRMRYLL